MGLSTDQLIEIMVGDHMRHISRQQREDAILSNDPSSRAALEDWTCERPLLKGFGSVTPPRKYPNRVPRAKTHGAAVMPSTPEQAELLASGQIEDSVLITHRDGTQEIKTVRAIRGNRTTEKTAPPSHTPAQGVPETARHTPQLRHDYNN